MTIADFTSHGLIVPQLRGRDAASVIKELSEALEREKRVPDGTAFCQAACRRELLTSTDMTPGIAFPHARVLGLAQLSFALGRVAEPLTWSRQAVGSVRLVFLMAIPAEDVTQSLALLSGLARFAKDGRFAEKLRAAKDAVAIFEELQQMELRAGAIPHSVKTARDW